MIGFIKNKISLINLAAAVLIGVYFILSTVLVSNAQTSVDVLDVNLVDGMVLQRDKPITLHGRTSAGEHVDVQFGKHKERVRVDGGGRWALNLPAHKAAENIRLKLQDSRGRVVEISDLSIGDVWLCSGQSNMDLPVRRGANPDRVSKAASRYNIKIAKVEKASAPARNSTLVYGIPWQLATSDSIGEFSSTCWHFGIGLREKIDVPIGLIHSAWGGTRIEDWMSVSALREIGDEDAALDVLELYEKSPKKSIQDLVTSTQDWAIRNDPESGPLGILSNPNKNIDTWPEMDLPNRWEESGVKNLRSYNGIMWFVRDFTLSESQALGQAKLKLGRINERDAVWVNGVLIGSNVTPDIKRNYTLPPGTLQSGRNRVMIRVLDERGAGGVLDQSSGNLSLDFSKGTSVSLAGLWKYSASLRDNAWSESPPRVPWMVPRGLTTTYNAMIAPLGENALKGIVWYQGESNANDNDSRRYGTLLRLWKQDWRTTFNDMDLPILIAQLPGFGDRAREPQNSNWAKLREQQWLTTVDDKASGIAVTIDLGVPEDIHPSHKKIVGERLASEAMRVAYGDAKKEPSAYPQRAVLEGDVIRIDFDSSAYRLNVVGGNVALGFELCDAQDTCVFAEGYVRDNDIHIFRNGLDVSEVRYAWANSPVVNLYDEAGLPVAPFRIALTNR